jgi:hypothetical protein
MRKHFPFQGPPKFTQIWIFGFENKPSGNPAWKSVEARNEVLTGLDLNKRIYRLAG